MELARLYLLLLFSIIFVCITDCHVHHIGHEPVLMIKLANSYQTQSFIDGQWSDMVEFDRSSIGRILAKCESPRFDCWSHDFGVMENTAAEPNTMANAIFICERKALSAENYFCATTWEGFARSCVVGVEDVGQCARRLPEIHHEAFLCFRMGQKDATDFMQAFYGAIHQFTRNDPDVLPLYTGGFLNFEFSNRSDIVAILQRPIKGAPKEVLNEILTKGPGEDIYEHFAKLVSTDMVVCTCSPMDQPKIASPLILDGPAVFNMHKSFHPVFTKTILTTRECAENANLAFNIPKNKEKDVYYVCFGDLPRHSTASIYGGGLYCWQNKELNLDLRCNTIPEFPLTNAEEVAYTEWYSDCPDHLRKLVLEEIRMSIDETSKSQMEGMELRNDEL